MFFGCRMKCGKKVEAKEGAIYFRSSSAVVPISRATLERRSRLMLPPALKVLRVLSVVLHRVANLVTLIPVSRYASSFRAAPSLVTIVVFSRFFLGSAVFVVASLSPAVSRDERWCLGEA